MVSPTCRAHLSCSVSTKGAKGAKGVRGLRCPFSQAWGMGLPCISSNALNFNLFLGTNHMQSKVIQVS